MARPREFDRDDALDRAIEVFWTRGYDRTSVQDLVDAMGIQRGSLYGTFGDKQSLFLEALDRYEERFYARMVQALVGDTPVRNRIAEVFREVVHDCACDDGGRGCFITNTAVGLAEGDEETARRVRLNLKRVEDAFEEAIVRAVGSASLRDGFRPRAIARFLTTTLQGLRVLSRCRVDVAVLEDAVDVALSVLELPVLTEETGKTFERRHA